jgi:RNA polymerase sigma-70 factor (ECF subfamily)
MPNSSATQIQALIDRLKAGDESARNELIDRAVERLRRLTRKMLHQDFRRVRRWHGTDDVLHNFVIRLLRALQAVPPGTTKEFFQLASRHIRWELIDLAKRCGGLERLNASAGKNRKSDREPIHGDPVTTTSGPMRLAMWAEFHEAVESLVEEERSVFELLWYQGCTQAESAAIMEISVATVKRYWLSARMKLAERAKGLADKL